MNGTEKTVLIVVSLMVVCTVIFTGAGKYFWNVATGNNHPIAEVTAEVNAEYTNFMESFDEMNTLVNENMEKAVEQKMVLYPEFLDQEKTIVLSKEGVSDFAGNKSFEKIESELKEEYAVQRDIFAKKYSDELKEKISPAWSSSQIRSVIQLEPVLRINHGEYSLKQEIVNE